MLEYKKKSLFIVEAPGKISSWKKSLSILGWNKVEINATCGRIRDLPKDNNGFFFENKKIVPQWSLLSIDKLDNVKKSIQQASQIIIATDNDPEGEWIAQQISELCKDKSFYRISVSAIFPELIQNALENPRNINLNTVTSVQSRRLFDRLVSTKNSNRNKSNTIGRILTPTLNSYNNELPRSIHIQLPLKLSKEDSSPHYLQLSVNKNEWKILKNNLDKYSLSENDLPRIIQNREEKTIDDTQLWSTKEALLNITTTLNISVKEAAENLQELYEEGDISYPRTDSNVISKTLSSHLQSLSRAYDVPSYKKDKFINESELSKHRHDAIVPLTARLNYRLPLNTMTKKDQALCLILRNTFRAVQEKRYNYKSHADFDYSDKNIAKFLSVFRSFEDRINITKEWTERGPVKKNENKLFKPFGIPIVQRKVGLIEITEDKLDHQILERIIKKDFAQPSTYHIHATKIANNYINNDGSLNKKAQNSINNAKKIMPLLLDEEKILSIIPSLFDPETLTLNEKIEKALNYLEQDISEWDNTLPDKDNFDNNELNSPLLEEDKYPSL